MGLEKSFGMIYSNLCLNSCETVPLNTKIYKLQNLFINFLHMKIELLLKNERKVEDNTVSEHNLNWQVLVKRHL